MELLVEDQASGVSIGLNCSSKCEVGLHVACSVQGLLVKEPSHSEFSWTILLSHSLAFL